jgi:ferric-dicitrate binding protein FerR (iron transport regulator)
MEHQIYHRILSGEASENEKEAFYETLSQDLDTKNEFIRLKGLWDLNNINQIHVSPERKKQSFWEFWSKTQLQKQKGTRKLYNRWVKYAAIVVVALVSGFYLNKLTGHSQATWKQFHAETGSISTILLEDGSKIWLNANSTISLDERRGQVTTKLTGEAYFQIVHNEKRTFIVDLGHIQIRDLGTSFNISAYPDEQYFRTTLIEGGLAITNPEGAEIRQLEPDQTFRYDQTNGTYKLEELNTTMVTGWKENKFVFIDKPLAEVCGEIEKWYGVSIVIEDEDLKQGTYTSVIRRPATVEQMMELFELTTGINYKVKNQNEKVTVIYLSK